MSQIQSPKTKWLQSGLVGIARSLLTIVCPDDPHPLCSHRPTDIRTYKVCPGYAHRPLWTFVVFLGYVSAQKNCPYVHGQMAERENNICIAAPPERPFLTMRILRGILPQFFSLHLQSNNTTSTDTIELFFHEIRDVFVCTWADC